MEWPPGAEPAFAGVAEKKNRHNLANGQILDKFPNKAQDSMPSSMDSKVSEARVKLLRPAKMHVSHVIKTTTPIGSITYSHSPNLL